MAGLASINIKFSADLRGFSTEIQNSMRQIGQMGRQLQETGKGLSLYLTVPLLAAGAASVKFASDYEESANKVNVAFGGASDTIKEFAKTSLENFGIAEGTALDMSATFGDMATALGLPVDKAATMSKSLVGLAGDLASFKNISIDIANTALTGIFTGETESLKKLGIVMTDANLQAFALSQGITKQFKDFTQAEKVQLRYAYILDKTTNAQGDFVRTGGGAANQTRIFQESLKQVGQQFGSVILPAFTKAITYVNGIIKSFSELSGETKTTIVVFAGIAAAIGPVLTGMGSLLTLVPNTISKFNSLKDSINGITAVLAANPFTAIAVALAAIVSIAVISTSRFTDLTNATKEFESINARAAETVAKETAELNKNIAIAKNSVLSMEVRKKAIDDINASYPELNNQLNLQNVNTEKGIGLTNQLTEALLKKARVQAAEEKLVDVQKKLLDLQLGQLDAVKPSVWQTLSNALFAAGNAQNFAAATASTIAKNYNIEINELVKLQKALQLFIGVNKDYTKTNQDANLSLEDIVKNQGNVLKVGTIAYYESLISLAQKEQKEVSTTAAQYDLLQQKIDGYQKKIDAISKKEIKLPKPEIPTADTSFETPSLDNSLSGLKSQLSYFEGLRENLSKTSDEYKAFDEVIGGLKLQIKSIEGTDDAAEKLKELQRQAEETAKALNAALVQGLGDAFESMGNKFIDSLALAKDGLQGFVQGLGQTVLKLLSMYLAQSISASIAGATAAGAATGPGAIFTTPAFISTAVSGVLAAFAAIPKFATGGVVSGNSFYGDRILARVNSGELILNGEQQRRLSGMLDVQSGPAVIPYIPDIKLKGSDILISIRRSEKEESRRGE